MPLVQWSFPTSSVGIERQFCKFVSLKGQKEGWPVESEAGQLSKGYVPATV